MGMFILRSTKSLKMEKLSALIFVFVNVLGLVLARSAMISTEDYYWKDFQGSIPSDAMPAGMDERSKWIYIGQVLVDNKVIPGRIHPNDSNIYYEFGEKAWTANENIKIFCTRRPEKFEWVPTNYEEVFQLKKVLIKGGHQPNFKTYIGRVIQNGIANVGKVVCRADYCLALYVNENGRYVEYHEFEILAYNPTPISNYIYRT